MICPANLPYEGKCRKEATVSVPTGYACDELMCPTHAERWADNNRPWFERMRDLYDRLGQQTLFEEAS